MIAQLSEDHKLEGLEATVRRRLGSRVRDFRLLVLAEGLVLFGQAATFHAKQLAQHAVMEATAELAGVAVVAEETIGWSYHRDRDLTGFVDGTENPTLVEAPALVYAPDGASVLLLQKWEHETPRWMALDVAAQEQAMGRTKPDSIELDDKPDTSHVARTDQDTYGHIFRRNTPYGTPAEHGTMFVGFCAEQRPLAAMLDSMAGLDGPRDELTRYTRPLTGAYYVVPAADALAAVAG